MATVYKAYHVALDHYVAIKVLHLKPNFPEGQLLQAEYLTNVGDTNQARQVLQKLHNNPTAPAWVLTETKSIEGKLP